MLIVQALVLFEAVNAVCIPVSQIRLWLHFPNLTYINKRKKKVNIKEWWMHSTSKMYKFKLTLSTSTNALANCYFMHLGKQHATTQFTL
jgi:hypothetical protein